MKKKQISITLEPNIQDKVESIRCFELQNAELSYNQVINMLVKEALILREKQRDIKS